MEINGKKAEGHEIRIVFDPEKQATSIQFKAEEFKTWDFVLAVLGMAKDAAELQRNVLRMNAMQQQAVEQARAQQLAMQLRR